LELKAIEKVAAAHEAVAPVLEPAPKMRDILHGAMVRPLTPQQKERAAGLAVQRAKEEGIPGVLNIRKGIGDLSVTKQLSLQELSKRSQEASQNAESAQKSAQELNKQPAGSVKAEYFEKLALGYERLALQYKRTARAAQDGRTKDALSMNAEAEQARLVLDSARSIYAFTADVDMHYRATKTLGSSDAVQQEAAASAAEAHALVKRMVPGGKLDASVLKTGEETRKDTLALAGRLSKTQSEYNALRQGLEASLSVQDDVQKQRAMAQQMEKKDSAAARALRSNADRLDEFSRGAASAPKQFAEAYRTNGMFGGEFSLRDRVQEAYQRAWTSVGLIAYGKGASGSHMIWGQLAQVSIQNVSLILSPVQPKDSKTAERSNQIARYARKDMADFQKLAFLTGMEGKLLSSDSQLRALDALSRGMDAASKRFAAALMGDFAAAAKHLNASANAERDFASGFADMRRMNIHLDAAGKALHFVASFLPPVYIANSARDILVNYDKMTKGDIALRIALTFGPSAAFKVIGKVVRTPVGRRVAAIAKEKILKVPGMEKAVGVAGLDVTVVGTGIKAGVKEMGKVTERMTRNRLYAGLDLGVLAKSLREGYKAGMQAGREAKLLADLAKTSPEMAATLREGLAEAADRKALDPRIIMKSPASSQSVLASVETKTALSKIQVKPGEGILVLPEGAIQQPVKKMIMQHHPQKFVVDGEVYLAWKKSDLDIEAVMLVKGVHGERTIFQVSTDKSVLNEYYTRAYNEKLFNNIKAENAEPAILKKLDEEASKLAQAAKEARPAPAPAAAKPAAPQVKPAPAPAAAQAVTLSKTDIPFSALAKGHERRLTGDHFVLVPESGIEKLAKADPIAARWVRDPARNIELNAPGGKKFFLVKDANGALAEKTGFQRYAKGQGKFTRVD